MWVSRKAAVMAWWEEEAEGSVEETEGVVRRVEVDIGVVVVRGGVEGVAAEAKTCEGKSPEMNSSSVCGVDRSGAMRELRDLEEEGCARELVV